MRLFYSLFIQLYGIGIRIASLFQPKAKSWVSGRKNIFQRLAADFSGNNDPVFWMHCASLGEFEQGRPLLEAYRKKYPTHKLLLTFFSPSGYEVRKNYSGADWIYYLPLDTLSNAKKIIKIVKPSQVVFVKYEYWYNLLHVLHQQSIPCIFISAIIREDHYFFKWYGKWALNQLKKVSHFFVQTHESSRLLQQAGIKQYTFAGDTRFDRVISVFEERKQLNELTNFCKGTSTFVAGSTWAKDESVLQEFLQGSTHFKLILAPHEINENNLNSVLEKFQDQGVQRYSDFINNPKTSSRVLIIDNIGMLSSLYFYGTFCYIGGGFGKGIHNILEAAVYGKPLFFGPNYQKFDEAKRMLELGAAEVIENSSELIEKIALIQLDEKKYRERCQVAYQFVRDNSGAVNTILATL